MKLEVGYRIDLMVEKKVIIEVKSVEQLNDVHLAQILTYLRLSECKLGLLINFNVSFFKNGVKRVVNNLKRNLRKHFALFAFKNLKMKIKKIILLQFFFLLVSLAKADDKPIYKDYAADSKIKTAKFCLNGLMLSEPILSLKGGDALQLTFDDLSDDIRSFNYSVQLCNYDWTLNTELSPFEYLKGFQENQLLTYQKSFNTAVPYVHYSVNIPNENVRLRKSGNYILIIKDIASGNVVLTKRFMVVDNQAAVTGQEIRPRNLEITNTNQQLDLQIDCRAINPSNPFDEIKMVIYQNDRWDNPITGVQPTFVEDNVLKYNSDQDLVFPATKEFRAIDLTTDRIRTPRIERINHDSAISEFYVFPEQLRSFKAYYYEKDWNGDYIIDKQEAVDSAIESDYVWVNWRMPFSSRLIGGDFYICGEITNWDTLSTFKMKYNPKTLTYEARALLKQGYYNYQIGYYEPETKKFDMTPAEGNWYETENQYTVLVYYHPFTGRYDQLVGATTIRTMK